MVATDEGKEFDDDQLGNCLSISNQSLQKIDFAQKIIMNKISSPEGFKAIK